MFFFSYFKEKTKKVMISSMSFFLFLEGVRMMYFPQPTMKAPTEIYESMDIFLQSSSYAKLANI
jgi:hypothetical protein